MKAAKKQEIAINTVVKEDVFSIYEMVRQKVLDEETRMYMADEAFERREDAGIDMAEKSLLLEAELGEIEEAAVFLAEELVTKGIISDEFGCLDVNKLSEAGTLGMHIFNLQQIFVKLYQKSKGNDNFDKFVSDYGRQIQIYMEYAEFMVHYARDLKEIVMEISQDTAEFLFRYYDSCITLTQNYKNQITKVLKKELDLEISEKAETGILPQFEEKEEQKSPFYKPFYSMYCDRFPLKILELYREKFAECTIYNISGEWQGSGLSKKMTQILLAQAGMELSFDGTFLKSLHISEKFDFYQKLVLTLYSIEPLEMTGYPLFKMYEAARGAYPEKELHYAGTMGKNLKDIRKVLSLKKGSVQLDNLVFRMSEHGKVVLHMDEIMEDVSENKALFGIQGSHPICQKMQDYFELILEKYLFYLKELELYAKQIENIQSQKKVSLKETKEKQALCKENCEKDIFEVHKIVSSADKETLSMMAKYCADHLNKEDEDERIDTYEKLLAADREYTYADQSKRVKASYEIMVEHDNLMSGRLGTGVKELEERSKELSKSVDLSVENGFIKLIGAAVLIVIMLLLQSLVVTGWLENENMVEGIAEGFFPQSTIVIALLCFVYGLMGCLTSLLIGVIGSGILGAVLFFAGGLELIARATVAVLFVGVALYLIISVIDSKKSKVMSRDNKVFKLKQELGNYKIYVGTILSEVKAARKKLIEEGLEEKYVDMNLGYKAIIAYYDKVLHKLNEIKIK